jgi:hypothetical protein
MRGCIDRGHRAEREASRSGALAWESVLFGGPYGIDARAHEVGLPVRVARRSSNSGALAWSAVGDRQPCITAGMILRHDR